MVFCCYKYSEFFTHNKCILTNNEIFQKIIFFFQYAKRISRLEQKGKKNSISNVKKKESEMEINTQSSFIGEKQEPLNYKSLFRDATKDSNKERNPFNTESFYKKKETYKQEDTYRDEDINSEKDYDSEDIDEEDFQKYLDEDEEEYINSKKSRHQEDSTPRDLSKITTESEVIVIEKSTFKYRYIYMSGFLILLFFFGFLYLNYYAIQINPSYELNETIAYALEK